MHVWYVDMQCTTCLWLNWYSLYRSAGRLHKIKKEQTFLIHSKVFTDYKWPCKVSPHSLVIYRDLDIWQRPWPIFIILSFLRIPKKDKPEKKNALKSLEHQHGFVNASHFGNRRENSPWLIHLPAYPANASCMDQLAGLLPPFLSLSSFWLLGCLFFLPYVCIKPSWPRKIHNTCGYNGRLQTAVRS